MANSNSAERTSKVQPIRPAKAATVDSESMDRALRKQCGVLYQAMGIVALAADAIREEPDQSTIERAWAALDGAHKLLDGIVDRLQSCGTLLATEVDHGDA